MPELNPQYAQFEKDVDSVLSDLLSRIKQGNFSKVQLAQIASEIDFLNELRAAGFEDVVNKYFNNYDKVLNDILNQAEKLGVRNIVGVQDLLVIKELDKEYLLRSASAWASKWESELLKSVIRGDTIAETINNLQGIPLTDAQLGTVLNTAYSDFSRSSTKAVYADKPEQRFRYEGGVIPTSSEECRWLVLNQKEEGYTAKEIEEGIETPFIHKYDGRDYKKGDPKVINWQGRNPNFNCIHEWVAI